MPVSEQQSVLLVVAFILKATQRCCCMGDSSGKYQLVLCSLARATVQVGCQVVSLYG